MAPRERPWGAAAVVVKGACAGTKRIGPTQSVGREPTDVEITGLAWFREEVELGFHVGRTHLQRSPEHNQVLPWFKKQRVVLAQRRKEPPSGLHGEDLGVVHAQVSGLFTECCKGVQNRDGSENQRLSRKTTDRHVDLAQIAGRQTKLIAGDGDADGSRPLSIPCSMVPTGAEFRPPMRLQRL